MRRVVKIKESDIHKVIEIVLEQNNPIIKQRYGTDPSVAPSDYLGRGREFERSQGVAQNAESKMLLSKLAKYSCVPQNMRFFCLWVEDHQSELMKKMGVDKPTLIFLTKASLGIIGRETTFGAGTEFLDDATEWLKKTGFGLQYIPDIFQGTYNTYRKIKGQQPASQSLGAAQFTPETWKEYNLDQLVGPYEKSLDVVGSGLGAMFRLITDYRKALNNGAGTGPSQNPISPSLKGKTINGTGNNAWDLSIVAHNMGPALLTSWCETNSPELAAPCSLSTFKPFPDTKKDYVLTVKRDKKIPNYFPNKRSGQLTSIGYLEEVSNYIKKFSCINF